MKQYKKIYLFFIISFLSCDKEGMFDTVAPYHCVMAYWHYYGGNDDDGFIVELQLVKDGDIIETQQVGGVLTAHSGVVDRYLRFSSPEDGTVTRLLLKPNEENATALLDTIVDLRDNSTFYFLQVSKSDTPQLFSEIDTGEEKNPSTVTSAKYQYYYSVTSLPDSLILIFYTYNDTGSPYYTDSLDLPARGDLTLYKGKFSPYIELDRISTGHVYFFLIKNAQNGSIIQGIQFLAQTLPINTATGYSNVITGNTGGRNSTNNKFISALIYKSGNKYKDKKLSATEWTSSDPD